MVECMYGFFFYRENGYSNSTSYSKLAWSIRAFKMFVDYKEARGNI